MSLKQMALVWEYSHAHTLTELVVLLALADWADDDGYCWPSIRMLAKKARISRRSVFYTLDKLVLRQELERWPREKLPDLPFTPPGGIQMRTLYRVRVVQPVHQVDAPGRPQGGATSSTRKVVQKGPASRSVSTTDPSEEEKQRSAFHTHPVETVENSTAELATYKQLEKLVHSILDGRPPGLSSIGELSDDAKDELARLHLSYDPFQLSRAVASVLVHRGYSQGRDHERRQR